MSRWYYHPKKPVEDGRLVEYFGGFQDTLYPQRVKVLWPRSMHEQRRKTRVQAANRAKLMEGIK